MSGGGMKNMVLMGSAMLAFRRLDQEDPDVIRYARLLFATYVGVCAVLNMIVHHLVVSRGDTSTVTVPPAPPSPFAPPPPEGVAPDAAGPTTMSVLAYDLGVAASARKGWVLNAAMLSAIHWKTGAVNPLLMSAVMGLARVVDDPLVRLYLLRAPAVGPLQRPFKPEANPLATALQGMLPKPPTDEDDDATPARGTRPVDEPAVVEELHKDEREDDDDDADDVVDDVDEHPEDNDFDDPPEDKKSK